MLALSDLTTITAKLIGHPSTPKLAQKEQFPKQRESQRYNVLEEDIDFMSKSQTYKGALKIKRKMNTKLYIPETSELGFTFQDKDFMAIWSLCHQAVL